MNEREIQEAVVKIRAIEQQLPTIQQNIEQLNRILIETATAINTLKETSKLEKETQTKTPIGSGVFITTKINKQEKALIEVGEGVIVEKSIDEIIKTLEAREKDIKENIEKLTQTIVQMEKDYYELAKKIQEYRQTN